MLQSKWRAKRTAGAQKPSRPEPPPSRSAAGPSLRRLLALLCLRLRSSGLACRLLGLLWFPSASRLLPRRPSNRQASPLPLRLRLRCSAARLATATRLHGTAAVRAGSVSARRRFVWHATCFAAFSMPSHFVSSVWHAFCLANFMPFCRFSQTGMKLVFQFVKASSAGRLYGKHNQT